MTIQTFRGSRGSCLGLGIHLCSRCFSLGKVSCSSNCSWLLCHQVLPAAPRLGRSPRLLAVRWLGARTLGCLSSGSGGCVPSLLSLSLPTSLPAEPRYPQGLPHSSKHCGTELPLQFLYFLLGASLSRLDWPWAHPIPQTDLELAFLLPQPLSN